MPLSPTSPITTPIRRAKYWKPPAHGVSFISQLPNELLSIIFDFAVNDPKKRIDDDTQTGYHPDTYLLYVSLIAVCKKWREIVLGMSGLFATIVIHAGFLVQREEDEEDDGADANGDEEGKDLELDTRGIERSLALSKTKPLSILIDARDPEWDFSEEEYVCLFLPF
jgi:hypothetical protein